MRRQGAQALARRNAVPHPDLRLFAELAPDLLVEQILLLPVDLGLELLGVFAELPALGVRVADRLHVLVRHGGACGASVAGSA